MKDIPGFEDYYAFTEDSKVWSYPRARLNPNSKTKMMKIGGKYLKPLKNDKGYPFFILSNGEKRKHVFLHRLVAWYHLPNPLNLREVNHKNGVKSDFRVENLEWVTPKQNMQHAFRTGLNKGLKGIENPKSKLSELDVLLIRAMIELGEMKSEIAVWFDIERYYVHRIKNRQNWAHI